MRVQPSLVSTDLESAVGINGQSHAMGLFPCKLGRASGCARRALRRSLAVDAHFVRGTRRQNVALPTCQISPLYDV